MGREVRRVPADWEHPKKWYPREGEGYTPLYDHSFSEAWADWESEWLQWKSGNKRNYGAGTDADPFIPHGEDCGIVAFCEWHGNPPRPEYYRPAWPEESRTHYQMYETVSEGTPISPVMESPETLARWLADNNGNAGAGWTATYEQWLRVCQGGYAPSMVIANGRLMSGVEGVSALEQK